MNDFSNQPCEPQSATASPFLSPRPDSLTESLHRLLRWVYTHNPFYVLSAALFFWGLRVSFDTTRVGVFEGLGQSIGLTAGLMGYTLVLAVTTFLVIRFGKVWEDGRSQLLLIVVMLLAISVSFDNTFNCSVRAGVLSALSGLAFSLLVSEGLLRGLRLRLGAGLRLPYYLILALFYLYPIPLGMMLKDPYDPAVPWVLLAFPAAAGVAFLSLVPAIRRGPEYVRNNGTPWDWPWFPWVLFFFLGLGICGRSYYLCVSMHLTGGRAAVFAPYFLVPFFFALSVLLLEIALVSRSKVMPRIALAAPLGMLALALAGCSQEKVPLEFLAMFVETLGATPLWITMLFVAAFYVWAVVRRVPLAVEALTATLLALAFVGPATLDLDSLIAPQPSPIFLAGVLQSGVALWRRSSLRCLVGACSLAAAAALQYPAEWTAGHPWIVSCHGALIALLTVGAAFDDAFARFLRGVGAVGVSCAGVAALTMDAAWMSEIPREVLILYPIAMIGIAVAYAYLVRSRLYLAAAAVTTATWISLAAVQFYRYLGQVIVGLNYLAWALVSFLAAVLISLMKIGALRQWLAQWKGKRWPSREPVAKPSIPGAE